MYRKIKIRRLLLLVIILLLVVGGLVLKDYFKGDRSYRTFVMNIDSAKVKSITISSMIPFPNTIKLYLDQKQWKVSGNGLIYSADPITLKRLINDLSQLKIETLAGTGKSNWSEFQVTDSSAIKVTIEEKGNKTLFIGKFSYQPPANPNDRQGNMNSYVRLAGQDETYSVQGFLRMNFAPAINNYRNRFLIRSSSDLFIKLTYTYPGDSSFILLKENNKWLIDGAPVDTVQLESYLTELEHLTSYEFADTIKHNNQPIFSLKIEGATLPSAIELKAYQTLSGDGYLINSSYNPEALFNGSAQNLTSKIFTGKDILIR
jgi:hypothetical protein